MPEQHLVVGAGPVGRHVAAILAERGDRVVLGSRSGRGPEIAGVTNVALDATDPDALTRAADGASAIFHTANPGPYPVWDRQWPLMSSALLTATERTGAVYAMAGNLYPLGPVTAPMHEGMPDDARDHLGALRARVWADALAAHRAGRIRAFEVRGSDYIGGESAAGHIGRALPTALKGKTVRMVGRVDTPHTFTDVNDVARLLVTVYDAPDAHGRVWHVPSHAPRTQRQMIDEFLDLAGIPRVAVRGMSPASLRTLGLFSPLLREVAQLSYQLMRPYVLDATAATERFSFAPSPWGDTLHRTLRAAGWQPDRPRRI
ncbi:NAD-dependent epimerase/dehydratase family protein [Streptomyces shenzhenensis]|uniref:NAD-dependent epimerase/dehydratase family protein n=1 Tax=Streptomyces shenzhenensis TaxID=943815 RepID=UPI001C80DD72|nr:NAD-dependent epimerase/dehydratase family protein [Streptomyces shenzhenensis]